MPIHLENKWGRAVRAYLTHDGLYQIVCDWAYGYYSPNSGQFFSNAKDAIDHLNKSHKIPLVDARQAIASLVMP